MRIRTLISGILVIGICVTGHIWASEPDTALALEQRVADLEAYVNNGSRVDGAQSKIMGPGPGHNGWLMVSSALVLFMTLPGLALFYGGLVRRKNVLSILAQCLGIAGTVTLLWWIVGYSLVFAPGTPIIGGLKYMFLNGVDSRPNTDYSAWVSHNIFAMFQMMFAIITPALIIGAVAEHMKYAAVLAFVGLWMFLVYFPLAHMVWGADGIMNGVWNSNAKIKALDFAGGTVVHMSSGWSALILCLNVGKRIGLGKVTMAPHSMVFCMLGTSILWIGWYGFNAGSALGADAIASNAFVTTTLATAVASITWAAAEWVIKGKPSVLGLCSGIVAGLVTITPACGFVTAKSAVLIGVLAGIVPFLACVKLKAALGYDDALDTFGIHGVGGSLGSILTGLLATKEVNPNLATNLSDIVGRTLWLHQLGAMAVTVILAIVGSMVAALLVKGLIGLRPSTEDEILGLDLTDHGEEGYILE